MVPASEQDGLYEETRQSFGQAFGPALERLARVYEADADLRRDLLQEIHIALWRSFGVGQGGAALQRCDTPRTRPGLQPLRCACATTQTARNTSRLRIAASRVG